MKKERIGIFGCSADPFTLAHREIVKEVLKQKLVDSVIIAPTIVDYHRGDKLPWLSSSEKLSIIRTLTNDLHPMFIDETELNRKDLIQLSPELEDHAVKSWRFIDTLLRIKLEYMNMHSGSDKEFYPIIGGDSLDNFKTWFAWKDILKQSAGLIAVERDNNSIDVKTFVSENPEFDGKLRVMKIYDGFAEMSASDMREMWRNHRPTEYLDWALATIEANKANEKINAKDNNLLLHTPIFDVIEGDMTKTGLKPILIDAPDWVMIIVRKNESFLIEKQFRYGCNNEILEFPCGIVEKNEKPFDAAMRELQEETGIRIIDRYKVERLGVVNPNPAFMMNRIHLFYVNLDDVAYAQVGQKLDAHEKLTYEFMDDFSFKQYVINHAYDGVQPAMLMSALWLYENV